MYDDFGNLIPHKASEFPWENAKCNLPCSTDEGPFSPMRGGAANNIYIIPAPNRLTFNAAFLIAAACCIPAILSLAFMWNKILEINWKARFGEGDENDEPIEGTNGATNRQMKGVNSMIRLFLSVIEIPLFGAAVLAILAVGETNLFSPQLRYQTEPIANIGQWGPIATTVFAALGSLYLLLAGKMDAAEESDTKSFAQHCNCSHHHPSLERLPTLTVQHGAGNSPDGRASRSMDVDGNDLRPSATNDLRLSTTRRTTDVGNRRKVASTLTTIGNKLGTAAHDKFDTSEFKRGKARDFPFVPAEMQRNPNWAQIREQYNPPRDYLGNVTPEFRPQRSRPGSFTNVSVSSGGIGAEASSSSPAPARRRDTLEVPSPAHHRTGST